MACTNFFFACSTVTLTLISLTQSSSQQSQLQSNSTVSTNQTLYQTTNADQLLHLVSLLPAEQAHRVYENKIFVANTTDTRIHNYFAKLLIDSFQNYSYAQKVLDIALSIGIATNDSDGLSVSYFASGLCQQSLGNYNRSKNMFEQAIKLNRSKTTVIQSYLKLGCLLNNHFQDHAKAIIMFEKTLQLDPENMQACNGIARILFNVDHQFTIQRVLYLFDKISKILGQNFDLYKRFAVTLMEPPYQNFTHARVILTKALSFNLTDIQRAHTFFSLALVDQYSRDYKSAIALFKQAIDLNPQNIVPYISCGDILIHEFQQYIDGVKFYIQGIQVDPNDPGNRHQKLWATLTHLLVYKKISANQVSTMIENTKNLRMMAKFGSILIDNLQEYHTAKSILIKCVEIDSQDWEVWHLMGIAQSVLGEPRSAIESLTKSIKLYPFWVSYRLLGILYQAKYGKHSDQARKMYETAIEKAPDHGSSSAIAGGEKNHFNSLKAECHYQLAKILDTVENDDENEKSIHHLQRAVWLDPMNIDARMSYAVSLLRYSYDIEAAFNTIKQGIEINPPADSKGELLGFLACLQLLTHNENENTTKLFQTAIYKYKAQKDVILQFYARYLLRNKYVHVHNINSSLATNTTIHREIEDILFKIIDLQADKNIDKVDDHETGDAFHQLALLTLARLNNGYVHETSRIYQQAKQYYVAALKNSPNSALAYVGEGYLLQQEYYKQYQQSITSYAIAIELATDKNIKINAIFNLEDLLIDYDPFNATRANYSKYSIELCCKQLITGFQLTFWEIHQEWVGDFKTTILKFEKMVDPSLLHQVLGLYYESSNQFETASMHFIKSIAIDDKQSQNNLIMVSHWKLGQIFSVYLNQSVTYTQSMQYFLAAVDQLNTSTFSWSKFQISEFYFDFGYFLQTKMNDIWNATKYYAKSIELNAFNIKANNQLDRIMEQNETMFSKFEDCACCSRPMIDSFQSIHTNNCGHKFHALCIVSWYEKNSNQEKSCPLCRKHQP